MTKIQYLTLSLGITSAMCHTIGLVSGNEYFNFFAAFLGRLSAGLYAIALSRFRITFFVPLVFALLNILTSNRTFMYLEFLSQGLLYQYVAYTTFKQLNKLSESTDVE